jgi:SAM-dependent methyltransferase
VAVDYEALNAEQSEAEHDPFSVGRYRQFGKHMMSGAQEVLDVGCATGRGGAALKLLRPHCTIWGLDCVKARLDRLPKDYSHRVVGFSTEVPLPSQSIDVILAGEFIEHLTYADVVLTLKEFRRLLRIGGQLLMTTPYPDYLRLRLTGASTLGGAHLSAHYPKQLAAMMQEAGFGKTFWRGSGRNSLLFGERFPVFSVYGSFLVAGIAS